VTATTPARPPAAGAERASAVLAARALTKSYGRRLVVQRVDLEIRTGEVVGLLGPNGAGKTTTFYMMVGLARPDSGQVLLGDTDITALPMYLRARAGIGYLPQEASIFRKLTAEENVRAILETLGLAAGEQRSQARRLLEELGILAMAKQPAYTLSGGERRRLEICRALATSPSFILLDEPFAGIDPLAVHEIQGIIGHLTERGIGILITDHNVRETLKITDRAYILREGEVFRSGTPSELASDEEVRRVYLGESFQLDERGPRAPGV
jgi:lipopolysaccharide export system ATP-binding protein